MWCFLWSVGAVVSAYYGWSPYAEANGAHATPGGHGGSGGGHFYGPMHK